MSTPVRCSNLSDCVMEFFRPNSTKPLYLLLIHQQYKTHIMDPKPALDIIMYHRVINRESVAGRRSRTLRAGEKASTLKYWMASALQIMYWGLLYPSPARAPPVNVFYVPCLVYTAQQCHPFFLLNLLYFTNETCSSLPSTTQFTTFWRRTTLLISGILVWEEAAARAFFFFRCGKQVHIRTNVCPQVIGATR